MLVKFVFVHEEASESSLAPLYCGPYLGLQLRSKFFCLQLGSRTDVVSVDCLKPAFSEDPISTALPPACRHPALRPALHIPDPLPSSPSQLVDLLRKGAQFQLRHLFLLGGTLARLFMTEGPAPLFLLGGVLWWTDVC